MSTWTVDLPWSRPPLSLNDRQNWRVKARNTADVRQQVAWAVRAAGVPSLPSCGVILTYAPRDARRRDADNLVATLKVACDAMVDAGVVPDDTPDLMRKEMPRIAAPVKGGRLWLTITDLTAEVVA